MPHGGPVESEIDAAQELIYQAFEEPNPRRQVALAREALKLSPDCADAYVILAEDARTIAEALELFGQGVAAGERALRPKQFEKYKGHFWGYMPTRPYMRARAGLADCLWKAGHREEAEEHCREMLRLNPGDNQGMRYRLAAMLFDLEYPCVMRVNPGMAIRTPLKCELELLAGCLKAIPGFLRERKSRATLPVIIGNKSSTFQFELLENPSR